MGTHVFVMCILYKDNMENIELIEPVLYRNFKDIIKQIDLSKEKEQILDPRLILDKKDDITIYYAAHNEVINTNASLAIVGICPGYRQMLKSFQTVQESKYNDLKTLEICKEDSRLFGATKKNLINMMIELGFEYTVSSKGDIDIFEIYKSHLHTTSLIRYPVMKNGKNYDGRNPDLYKNDFLHNIAKKSIEFELSKLHNLQLIIPLGSKVEEFILKLFNQDNQIKDKVLRGFPHPSGLNAHRNTIFEKNKESMQLQVSKYIKYLEDKTPSLTPVRT